VAEIAAQRVAAESSTDRDIQTYITLKEEDQMKKSLGDIVIKRKRQTNTHHTC